VYQRTKQEVTMSLAQGLLGHRCNRERIWIKNVAGRKWTAKTCSSFLYTSGSTGKPKRRVHTLPARYRFIPNISFWECISIFTWRCYWLYGWYWLDHRFNSHIVYGPLTGRCHRTFNMSWGSSKTYLNAGKFWAVCEKTKVKHSFTLAPTGPSSALQAYRHRTHRRLWFWYSLKSTRLRRGNELTKRDWHLAYHTHIGKNKCPIVRYFGGKTETGGNFDFTNCRDPPHPNQLMLRFSTSEPTLHCRSWRK